MTTEDMMKWTAGILAGVGWFVLVLMKMAPVDQFVLFSQGVLLAMGAHGMTVSGRSTAAPLPPPADDGKQKLFITGIPGQGGRMMFGLLCLVAAGALFLLGGCASIPGPIVDAAKVSHENEVSNLKLLVCELPVGVVLRHQELQAFIAETCRP